MHASKISDLPLFTIVVTLAVLLLVAVAGLSLTIKREYLRTFVSLQTGYAYAQSCFLDNEGDDAKRVNIFFFNERHWRAIRDRVREWVLGMYAVWKALMPSWFTTDLQSRIPDEFMPAEIVHGLNAHTPGGRRPTLQNMGLLRRVSHAAVVTEDGPGWLFELGWRHAHFRPHAPRACVPAGDTSNRGGVDGDGGEAHDRRSDCCEPCRG